MNIVFVCTGNTCRSPMAEAIFREKTQEFSGYCTVSSCGLAASVGSPPSDNAVKVMSEIGIDISAHRSNPMSMYIIDRADYIICLSESHLNALKPYAEGKLMLLGGGIADPFAGSEDTYRECRDEISDGIDKLLASDVFFEADAVNETDADEIAKMEKSIFSDPWSRDSVISQIKKDYNVSFVGRFLGKPVAYVFADMICGEIYVGKVAVDEKMRKHGYARQLMSLLIEFAKKNSCSLITLEVRDSNNAAINLYKKFGFESLGKRKGFYSKPAEDAVIMTLYLR